jgi:hypothetical protein
MSSTFAVDRSRLCTYTFANGCQCRIPLTPRHPYLCTFHARKNAKAGSAQRTSAAIVSAFPGGYISGHDVSIAMAHAIAAIAQRHITPRMASSIAYLGQTLLQAVRQSESEYQRALGEDSWKDEIVVNFSAHTAPSAADLEEPSEIPADAAE